MYHHLLFLIFDNTKVGIIFEINKFFLKYYLPSYLINIFLNKKPLFVGGVIYN
jgi:hypothetical protein